MRLLKANRSKMYLVGMLDENNQNTMSVYLNIVIVGWANIALISFGFIGGYCEYLHIVFCWDKTKKFVYTRFNDQNVNASYILICVKNIKFNLDFLIWIKKILISFISIPNCHEQRFQEPYFWFQLINNSMFWIYFAYYKRQDRRKYEENGGKCRFCW